MVDTIKKIVDVVLSDKNIELVDVEVHTGGRRPIVRLFIHKESGVSARDCATISRELDVNFLVEDKVPDDTVIEVSSPGIGRPLKSSKDFVRNLGRNLEVVFIKEDKEKKKKGELVYADEDIFKIKSGKDEIVVEYSSVMKAKQIIKF